MTSRASAHLSVRVSGRGLGPTLESMSAARSEPCTGPTQVPCVLAEKGHQCPSEWMPPKSPLAVKFVSWFNTWAVEGAALHITGLASSRLDVSVGPRRLLNACWRRDLDPHSPFPRLSQCEDMFRKKLSAMSQLVGQPSRQLPWSGASTHPTPIAWHFLCGGGLWLSVFSAPMLPTPTPPPQWEGSQCALLPFRVLKHYWKGTRDSYLVPQDGLHLQEEHDHTAAGITRGLLSPGKPVTLQGGLWNHLPFQMKLKNPSVPGFGTAPPGLWARPVS